LPEEEIKPENISEISEKDEFPDLKITETEEETPTKLFRTLDEIRATAKPIQVLWGFHLFKRAITAIIGDPGVGKTTFGYALGKSLCLNEAFLGIKAECPVSLIYLDMESSDSLVASRTNLLYNEQEIVMKNFIVYNNPEKYITDVKDDIVKMAKSQNINLLLVDNQTVAFNTRDENDNSEAAKQMKWLRKLTNDCNAAMVLFHHTNKANSSGMRKGTGAFARARLADVIINLELGDADKTDEFVLDTVKNRLIEDKPRWNIHRKGAIYEIIETPLSFGGVSNKTNTVIFKVQQEVMALFADKDTQMKRKDIIDNLIVLGYDERIIAEAITKLSQFGRIYTPVYGMYKRKV